jgi:hypothetical protein
VPPPSSHQNPPLWTVWSSDGSTDPSRGPHTRRGRSTIVRISGPCAASTSRSAAAFDAPYGNGLWVGSGTDSSTATRSRPTNSAASVPTCTNHDAPAARAAARTEAVPAGSLKGIADRAR